MCMCVCVCVTVDLQASAADVNRWRLDLLKENKAEMHGRVTTQNERASKLLKQQVSELSGFKVFRSDLKVLESKLSSLRRGKLAVHRLIREIRTLRQNQRP